MIDKSVLDAVPDIGSTVSRITPVSTGIRIKLHGNDDVTIMSGLMPAGGCIVRVKCMSAIASATANAAAIALEPNIHNTDKPTKAEIRCPPST
jgi:hypothetical protein